MNNSFSGLGLSGTVLSAVKRLGYDTPTPIQQQAIPLVLRRSDLIAAAQTGTGKTAAFCLPAFDLIGHARKQHGPHMLVITPTRELADQISAFCKDVAKVTNHKVTTIVGGVSYEPQREELRAGTDILIATPGRLEDLLGTDDAHLDEVSLLVLDEADRMLDMGFLPSVRRIIARCPQKRQTLLFSATMGPEVDKAAKQFTTNAQRVEVARHGATADKIEQYVIRIAHAAKPSCLKALLAERGAERTIVFARTRHRADSVAKRINKMGIPAGVIHSDRTQNQRRRALDQFANGQLNVLVATDILARGIDINEVDCVINYDLPTVPEDYVHRIGRTGRAGHSGVTISLLDEESADSLKAIEKLIKLEIPEMVLRDFDVQAAEEEAAARSMQLQARRSKDPEIEAVVKELNAKAKAQRRAEKRKQAQAPRAQASKSDVRPGRSQRRRSR